MRNFLHSILCFKQKALTFDDQSDFSQKIKLDSDRPDSTKFLMNVRWILASNTIQAELVILIFQLIISLLQPQYDSLFKNILSDLSILTLIALCLKTMMYLSIRRLEPDCLLYLLAGYSFKAFVGVQLMQKQTSFILLMMFANFHSLTRLISHIGDEHIQKLMKLKFMVAFVVLLFICHSKAFEVNIYGSLNATSEYQIQLHVLFVILYYWLEFQFHKGTIDIYIYSIQEENVKLSKTIEENEVHGAQLVHELRNPLNSMMGSITLLEKTLPVKTQQSSEVLSVAKCCGEHLHTLIGNLLEFSKLKAKKVELNKGQVDLKSIVRKIVKMSYFKAKEKSNTLRLEVSQNFPRKIVADEQRINQILINLISNAIKFTDKGNVTVQLGWKPIIPGQSNHAQTYPQNITQGGESERSQNIQYSQTIKYIEEKYLFKNFGEQYNPDDNSIDHQTSLGSLSKLESKNDNYSRHTSNINYDQFKPRFESCENQFMRSHSDHDNKLGSARIAFDQLRRDKNMSQQNNAAFKPPSPQVIKEDVDDNNQQRENHILLGQFNFAKGHTTTFLYNKGQNTTFQLEEEENYDENKINEAIEQVDKQQIDDEPNKFQEIDDFLFDQQDNQDNEKETQQELCNTDFQNELDVFLLQDENVSARENQGQNVRCSILKKDLPSQLEASADQNNWKVSINYGTPPQRHKESSLYQSRASGADITEQDRNVIDMVVTKHRQAQSTLIGNQNQVRSNSDDLFSLKDGSQSTRRENTLESNLHTLDKTNKMDLKFFGGNTQPLELADSLKLKYEKQYSSVVSNELALIQNQQSEEEKKLRSKSLNSASVDDNKLLMQSLLKVKKYQSPKKKESSQLSKNLNVSVQEISQNFDIKQGLEEEFKQSKEIIFDKLSDNNQDPMSQSHDMKQHSESVTQIDPSLFSFKNEMRFSESFDKQSDEMKKGSNRNNTAVLTNTIVTPTSSQATQHPALFTPSLGPIDRNQQKLQQVQDIFTKSQSKSNKEEVKNESPTKSSNKIDRNTLNIVYLNSSPLMRITEEPKEQTTSDQTSNKTGKNTTSEVDEFGNRQRSKTQKKLRIMIQELDKEEKPMHTNSLENAVLSLKQNTLPLEKLASIANDLTVQSAITGVSNGTRNETKSIEEAKEPLPTINIIKEQEAKIEEQSLGKSDSDKADLKFTKPKSPSKKRLDFLSTTKKTPVFSALLTDYQPIESSKRVRGNSKGLDLIQETQEADNDLNTSLKLSTQHQDSIAHSSGNINQFQGIPMNVKRYSTMCLNNLVQVVNQEKPVETSPQIINQLGDRGLLEIRVKDEGIGISQDSLKKLFKPYIQADKTIQQKYGGTGLGLCICHELIQIMSGTIDVTSTLGEGTEFIVNIPLEISNDVTLYVEDNEFDKEMSEIDLNNYEFAVCNNQSSFGISQIKKNFLKNRNCNIYIKEVHEYLTIGQKNSNDLFKMERTYKAFIVDYQSLRNNSQNLLQILSNHNDQIKFDSNLNSPSLTSNQSMAQKLFTIKVPVIVLISPFLDESRVKKSDNIFVLRVPFDARSMRKILIFLKRYYQNHIQSIIQKQFPQSQQNQNSVTGGSQQPLRMDTQPSKQDSLGLERMVSIEQASGLLQINGLGNSFVISSDKGSHQQQLRTHSGIDNNLVSQTMKLMGDSLLEPHFTLQRSSSGQNEETKNQDQNSDRSKNQFKSDLASQRQHNQPLQRAHDLKGNSSFNVIDDNASYKQMKDTPDSRKSGMPSSRSVRPMHQQSSFTGGYIQQKKRLATKNVLESTFSSYDQKCLVVNDDSMCLKITSMLLECSMNEQNKCFTIINAQNGQEAVDKYKEISNIKLILMDIEMPMLDGYEATKRIREYEEERGNGRSDSNMAFIIGVSGNSNQSHFRKCQQVGMNEAVTIPISNTKINELVSKLF